MAPRLGLQLYSLREALDADFPGALRRIAGLGFAGVETAFFPEAVPVAEAGRQLRALDLTVLAAHTPLPLGAGREEARRIAEAVGCRRIVWHGWPRDPRYDTIDGVRRLADEFNAAGAAAAADGLTLGIHNHWWECEPVEGELPYRVLLAELDPAIFVELDAYWARVAGLDPAAVAGELAGRMPLLHLKDGPATRGVPMAALGTGALDIPAVLRAAGDEIEWAIVELDQVATDPFEAVQQSHDYLSGQGLAIGRV